MEKICRNICFVFVFRISLHFEKMPYIFFLYFGGINAQKQCTLCARYAQLPDQILHANRKVREEKNCKKNIDVSVCDSSGTNEVLLQLNFLYNKKQTWIWKNVVLIWPYEPWCIFPFEIVCTTKESSSSYFPFNTGTNSMKCRLSQWFL